ncbi:hypothetical protein KBF38_23755 [bacterium]|nr:hypothetical protein [bacterium]
MTDLDEDPDDDQFNPRAFMEARRPHLFSDAEEQEVSSVDRGLLEYTLETLTSRQEEIKFEQFALHLAKKEICKNLIPHTGPTGGGDGKTDSENYQVSEEIAALWYIGDPKRASTEKFAFCFTAKKDWKPKFKSDIASVMSTGRNFSVIYFITNQFVSSRERADLQDAFNKDTGKEVKLLDRQWIVDKVIENKRWDVVSQHLNIGDQKAISNDGPRNLQNKKRLEAIEKEIEEAEYQGLQFAEDCFEAALLARNIGLPSIEVFGRFERAERASEKIGSKLQLFRILYKRAWTAYWWYNDFPELSRLYEKAEELVLDNDSAFILQDLSSICQIGLTASAHPKHKDLAPLFEKRAASLKASLKRIISTFPDTTNGLWAETHDCVLTLSLNAGVHPDRTTKFSNTLKDILLRAKTHAGYPVEAIYHVICEEFSTFITDNDAFDELFELVMDIQSQRVSESTKGKNRFNRGLQLYASGRNYQALDQLTKAQILLAKDELIEEYVLATFAAGVAFRDVGLFWAARANMAVATSLFLQFKQRSAAVIPPKILLLLQELADTELLLSRPLSALQVIELSLILASEMKLSEPQMQKFRELDMKFAWLILGTETEELTQLETFPEILKSYLQLSSSVLLFCLGYEDKADEWIEPNKIKELVDEIAPKTVEQVDTVCSPTWYLKEPFILKSRILGCELEVVVHTRIAILIAESLLAFVENFLATAVMLKNCMALRASVRIELVSQENSSFEFEEIEDEYGVTTLLIKYSYVSINDFADTKTYQKKLFDCAVEILKHMELSLDEESLKELFEQHEVLNRCQFAASSLTSTLKLFGSEAKYTPVEWLAEAANLQAYKLARDKRWLQVSASEDDHSPGGAENNEDAPPFYLEMYSHRDFSFQTAIDMRIWRRALWSGTAFGIIEGDLSRIEFWLTFGDLEVAKKIFRGWIKKVGRVDAEEWLGVSIITGIDSSNPYHYRVVLSVSEAYLNRLKGKKGLLTLSPATLTMTPSNSANLDRFLKAYNQAGWYDLGPAQICNGQMNCETELTIQKKNLDVVPAWQIGEQHYLVMALGGIKNPVIPADVSDAPVLAALKKYQSLPDSLG